MANATMRATRPAPSKTGRRRLWKMAASGMTTSCRREAGITDQAFLQFRTHKYQQTCPQHLEPLPRCQAYRAKELLHDRHVGIDQLQGSAGGKGQQYVTVAQQPLAVEYRGEDIATVDQVEHLRRYYRIDRHGAGSLQAGAVIQLPEKQAQSAGRHQYRNQAHPPDKESG